MTNEEKARELAFESPQCQMYIDNKCTQNFPCDRFKVSLAMAEWKDEKIDTIMLTIECCLRSFFESQGNTKESIDNFIDALKTQINENLNKL
jgi:hypothetical protein